MTPSRNPDPAALTACGAVPRSAADRRCAGRTLPGELDRSCDAIPHERPVQPRSVDALDPKS